VAGELVQIERGMMGMSPTDPTYTASIEFFILDDRSDPNERGGVPLRPRTSAELTELTPQELTDFLTGLLEEMPFSDSISDVEERMFDYLLHNLATYVMPDGEVYPASVAEQCIAETDAVVMNEILLQLLRGLKVQFIATEDLYSYVVPITVARGGLSSCRNVREFF
jgi:hypothetical protein